MSEQIITTKDGLSMILLDAVSLTIKHFINIDDDWFVLVNKSEGKSCLCNTFKACLTSL